jgi:hypothetical protein
VLFPISQLFARALSNLEIGQTLCVLFEAFVELVDLLWCPRAGQHLLQERLEAARFFQCGKGLEAAARKAEFVGFMVILQAIASNVSRSETIVHQWDLFFLLARDVKSILGCSSDFAIASKFLSQAGRVRALP